MALHIQMSDEAVRKLRQSALINKLVSFGVCTGMLLLFGGILYFTILIIQGEVPSEFLVYTPPSEDGPPTNQPVQKELSSKSSVPTPTVTPSVIVAQNAVSAVAAPVSIDTTGDLSFEDLDVSLGFDTDMGDGLGADGGGLGSGSPGGSALEGTLYDLKRTRGGAVSKIPVVELAKDKDGKPRKDADGKQIKLLKTSSESCQHAVAELLGKFFNGNWNAAILAPYWQAENKLYASHFYLPQAKAEYAPKVYKAKGMQDAGWIAIYRGRVRAPKSGKFRFVGTGDDYLGVRFDKKSVLEAGYRIPSLFTKDDIRRYWVSGAGDKDRHWKEVKEGKRKGFEGYELISHIKEIRSWNANLGGLTAGKVFEVKEGQVYPIEVAISEIPGGGFGFVLFIEDVTNGKVPAGGKYDLFRTNFSMPDRKQIFDSLVEEKCLFQASSPKDLEAPPFNEDSPIWTAVP